MNEANSTATSIVPEHLRLLKWNELVRRGDFVEMDAKVLNRGWGRADSAPTRL